VVNVPLTAVTTAALLPSVLVDALKVPGGSQTPRAHLLDFLREKEMLLFLDNMEQLLGSVDLLDDILTRAPGVTLLVTSRERLNLRQEWVYEVAGLTYPGQETRITNYESRIMNYESPIADHPVPDEYSAVALFIQRARQVRRDFAPEMHEATIARICQLVEGLPLAVELAAAWVDVRSCEVIADDIAHNLDALTTRWRNAVPRHRSLRATFDHSGSCSRQKNSSFSGGYLCSGEILGGGRDDVDGSAALFAALTGRKISLTPRRNGTVSNSRSVAPVRGEPITAIPRRLYDHVRRACRILRRVP
jgi:predicted ATPase